jgi:hypothetical protein
LGKLLRTLYLCDYLGNPAFRSEILDLLNQGESVHSLERAIHTGGIGAKRGRTPEQMAAISGALLLLANILMVGNIQRMQAFVQQTPEQFPADLLRKIVNRPRSGTLAKGTGSLDIVTLYQRPVIRTGAPSRAMRWR